MIYAVLNLARGDGLPMPVPLESLRNGLRIGFGLCFRFRLERSRASRLADLALGGGGGDLVCRKRGRRSIFSVKMRAALRGECARASSAWVMGWGAEVMAFDALTGWD